MKTTSFYIKNYCYLAEGDTPDLSFVPTIQRRKLSPLDKIALGTMSKVFTPEVEEIVFASKIGEFDRLKTIIEEYQEFGEVSPAKFSASVHNYPAGFFCLINKLNIPYFALAAGEESFKNGLIKAIISDKKNVLFTHADKTAFSCIVSKTEGTKFELNEIDENFIELLKERTK